MGIFMYCSFQSQPLLTEYNRLGCFKREMCINVGHNLMNCLS